MLLTKKIQKLFVATLLPALVIFSVFQSGFLKEALTVSNFAVFTLVVFVLVFLLETEVDHISVTLFDLLLLGYIFYRFINGFIYRETDYLSSQLLGEIAICCVYAIIRSTSAFREVVIFSSVLVGFAECVMALLQSLNFASGQNEFFNITGTFSNPGQLGGFIAVQLFLLVYLTLIYWKRSPLAIKILLLLLLMLFVVVIFISQSRASWLAVVIGGIYIILSKFRNVKFNLKPSLLMSLKILGVGFIIALSVLLYRYKKDSADGRLLIWRVTLNMVADRPFLGHGAGSFQEKYFAYQANYFAQNPDSRFLLLADNPSYAFNEYLQIAAELGIIGLLIILSAISMLFISKKKAEEELFLKAAFLSFCIFAFFSYPSGVFMLSVLSAMLLAVIPSPVSFRFYSAQKLQVVVSLLCIPLLYFFLHHGLRLAEANQQMKNLYSGDDTQITKAHNFIQSNYCALKNEPAFIFPYAFYFSDHLEKEYRLKVLDDAGKLVPSVEIVCKLGKLHQQFHRFKDAESCFIIASNAVPARVLPNYYLFQLYVEQADTISAIKMAQKILQQPLKLENTVTIKVRAMAKNILENNHQ